MACTLGCSADAPSDASRELTLPNGALSFDGASDFVLTGTAAFPNASHAQTISLWAKYPSVTGTETLVALRTDQVSGIVLGFRSGSLAAWSVFGGEGLLSAPTLPTAGVWHHLAYTYDGTTHTLYVDAAVVSMSTTGPDNRSPSSGWIGSYDGLSEFFRGSIDEVRIWAVARTGSEIADDMAGRVAADAPGLVAYYGCNHILDTRLPDDSGHGNAGSLGGGDPMEMPAFVASDAP